MHTYLEGHLPKSDNSCMIVHYTGNPKIILNCLDKIEKNTDLQKLYLLSRDVKQLKKDFSSLFRIVPAAGGLVLNERGKVLLIYRRGRWDLPKGKIEDMETKKDAAKREVMEETGLSDVKIIKKLTVTYHIYRGQNSRRRILKPSHWYLMYAKDQSVSPQLEEDIDHVEWTTLSEKYVQSVHPIFINIKDVLWSYIRLLA